MYWLFGFLLQISFVHFSICFLPFIDLLGSFLFCIMSINPIIVCVGNIFYQSMTSLLPFFFGVFIYTEDFTLHVVQSVVFSFLASEFRNWLRRNEPFIVYPAFSF